MNFEEVLRIVQDIVGDTDRIMLGQGFPDNTKSIWFKTNQACIVVDTEIRVYEHMITKNEAIIFTDIFDFQEWAVANLL